MLAWINPAAGIGDTGLDKALGGRLEFDGHSAARRRKFDGVADKIPEDLFQFIAVPLDCWKLIRMHDLNVSPSFRLRRCVNCRATKRAVDSTHIGVRRSTSFLSPSGTNRAID